MTNRVLFDDESWEVCAAAENVPDIRAGTATKVVAIPRSPLAQPRPSAAMAGSAVPGGPFAKRRAMTAAQSSGDIKEVSTSRS